MDFERIKMALAGAIPLLRNMILNESWQLLHLVGSTVVITSTDPKGQWFVATTVESVTAYFTEEGIFSVRLCLSPAGFGSCQKGMESVVVAIEVEVMKDETTITMLFTKAA
jgi:hypothetical protein